MDLKELINNVIDRIEDLLAECGCEDRRPQVEQELMDLKGIHLDTSNCEMIELSSCTSCLIEKVLEASPVKRYYIESNIEESTASIYILNDTIIEVDRGGGIITLNRCLKELLELLESLGYNVSKIDVV